VKKGGSLWEIVARRDTQALWSEVKKNRAKKGLLHLSFSFLFFLFCWFKEI